MRPAWVTPVTLRAPRIRILTTLRGGGESTGRYAGLNLALHVGDEPAAVANNRRALRRALLLPVEPLWMRQVHGTGVVGAEDVPEPGAVPTADAAVCRAPGRVLAVLTADCLPIVLAARDGTAIGIAHAGWRGLAAGVLEAALEALALPSAEVVAWIGPGISAASYEVDEPVRAAFAGAPGATRAFTATGDAGHWHCDLPALAEARLRTLGVGGVEQSGLCTFSDPDRFYSYRRDGETGRMATLAWIESGAGEA